ncbi:MAG: CsbD family protein [Acidimicrobiia bacterium]
MREDNDTFGGGTDTKWSGRWDQLKGKAKESWGHLTDDDLDVAEGEFEQMIGRIKERTGETEENIRQRLAD